jgi:hypothetical protein
MHAMKKYGGRSHQTINQSIIMLFNPKFTRHHIIQNQII